jgi:hypothetical protein
MGGKASPTPQTILVLLVAGPSRPWRRPEFIAMGKAPGGGSGQVFLSRSPHDRKLIDQWAAHHSGRNADSRARFVTLHHPKEVTMHRLRILAFCCAVSAASAIHAQDIDWKKVDTVFGRSAAVSGQVHRYGFPRTDLHVTVDGVTIRPALALGGWVAFTPAHDGVMIMGDLVLTDTEINPVMKSLLEHGVEVTALHNHLLRANPATYYMHVGGHGDPQKMAMALRTALDQSKTPMDAQPATSPPPPIDLDTEQLDQIMGVKGQANGGVYQFGVPRREPATEDGMAVTGPMGGANGIGFQPTGGGKAAITGDFLVTGEEVNPLISTLRAHNIEVTAIHSHMLDEQPRMFFIHFWANDDAIALAKGVRAALDKTAAAKS